MASQPVPIRIERDRIDTTAILIESVHRTDSMAQNAGRLSYGSVSLDRNDVGLLGEHATREFLRDLGIHADLVGDTAEGRYSGMGDIAAWIGGGEVRLEIKTQRFKHWKQIGLTVNARQLDRLGAPVIVWCVVSDRGFDTESVFLLGWYSTNELRGAQGQTVTIANREYRQVTETLKPMADLVPWLDAQVRTGALIG